MISYRLTEGRRWCGVDTGPDPDADFCDWEGDVTIHIVAGTEFWMCPRCGAEHEDTP